MKRIVKWGCYLCLLSGLLSSYATAASLSRQAIMVVQRAQTLFDSKQMKKAVSVLTNFKSKQDYDNAYIQQMLGVYYWQLAEPKKSVAALSEAVKSEQLVGVEAWSTQRMLADILLSEQKYSLSLVQYQALLKRKPIPKDVNLSDVWLRIAQIYYQQNQWQSILKAMSNYEMVKGKTSTLSLSLTVNAHLQLKQWNAAESDLITLRSLDPENSVWWQQLLFVQRTLQQHKAALTTLALAQRQGLMTSQNDRLLLAQLYNENGIPRQAALLLTEIPNSEKNVTMCLQEAWYWQEAKSWRKSELAWQHAAQLDPQYYWELSQLQMKNEQYQAAILSLDKITNSKISPQIIFSEKMNVYVQLGEFTQALSLAHQEYDNTHIQTEKWIQYLQDKILKN